MKSTYKEDVNLPEWVNNPDITIDERAFKDWYEKTFQCDSSPRSARFYQLRRAWMGSKEHYSK